MYGYNYFTKIKTSENTLETAAKNALTNGMETNKKINLKRIPKKYTIGGLVFIRAKRTSSFDQIWKGPFKIIEIDYNENRVCVKESGMLRWFNIKFVKPFLGGEYVVKNHTT